MGNRTIRSIVLATSFSLALSSCAIQKQDAVTLYDLGPQSAHQAGLFLPPGMPPVLIAGVQAPYWLDNMMIHYRLTYANDQQIRSYAFSRWNMPPARLMEQKLTARIAAAGGVVLRASDGINDGIMLRMELDDFSQRFDSPSQSIAGIELRVSAFRKHTLLGQKTFRQNSPAPTSDAAGGVRALATASDAIADRVMAWLAELRQKTND